MVSSVSDQKNILQFFMNLMYNSKLLFLLNYVKISLNCHVTIIKMKNKVFYANNTKSENLFSVDIM